MSAPYSFGERSEGVLAQIHPALVLVARTAIMHIDFSLLEGFRDEDTQNYLFKTGASKLKWPDSKHNVPASETRAFDFAPYPVDWTDHQKFRHIAFFMQGIAAAQGVHIRLGADWSGDFSYHDETYFDLGHVELC